MTQSGAVVTTAPNPLSRRVALLGAAAVFALAFAGAVGLHAGSTLHDTDSAFHLAAARAYAQGDVPERFPPLRFSLLGDGFGDKEWLFHRALAPFTWDSSDPRTTLARGRLALAFFEALALTAVAVLALRFLGLWGLLVPFGLVVGSTELAWRLVRLRPELSALPLLLAAVWALGTARYRLLGALALVFTLAYTAFQAVLGLAFLTFLLRWWQDRAAPWAALLYPTLGVGLGLVVHPHFPHNLQVWAAQNLSFFELKDALAVGTEIQPNFTDVLLMANLGGWLGLLVLVRSTEPDPDPPQPAAGDAGRHLADAFGVAAVAFGLLYLLMSRFSLYFVPFATLWLLAEIRRRGLRVGRWTRLPGRGRVPLALALGLALLVSLPVAWGELGRYRARTSGGPEDVRLADRDGLAAALPDGARVAADWGSTGLYLLWAPQGRYLNALDPVFMAIPHPERQQALARILEGSEPDVPLTAHATLESDFLAFSPIKQSQALLGRLAEDPRVEPLYRGFHHLYRFVPDRNHAFVLDWRVVPADVELPVTAEFDIRSWPLWPRAEAAELRALEGWVDADRVLRGAGECLALVRDVEGGERVSPTEDVEGTSRWVQGEMAWELTPHGPTRLWLDGELRLDVRADLGSVLGQGVRFAFPSHDTAEAAEAAAGATRHRLTVLTCRERDALQGTSGRAGFYLSFALAPESRTLE